MSGTLPHRVFPRHAGTHRDSKRHPPAAIRHPTPVCSSDPHRLGSRPTVMSTWNVPVPSTRAAPVASTSSPLRADSVQRPAIGRSARPHRSSNTPRMLGEAKHPRRALPPPRQEDAMAGEVNQPANRRPGCESAFAHVDHAGRDLDVIHPAESDLRVVDEQQVNSRLQISQAEIAVEVAMRFLDNMPPAFAIAKTSTDRPKLAFALGTLPVIQPAPSEILTSPRPPVGTTTSSSKSSPPSSQVVHPCQSRSRSRYVPGSHPLARPSARRLVRPSRAWKTNADLSRSAPARPGTSARAASRRSFATPRTNASSS